MTMRASDWLVVLLMLFQTVLAAAIAAEPGSLGVPAVAVAWMAIANVGVGVLLNQLRRLGGGDGG